MNKVLSVGQCGYDNSNLSRKITSLGASFEAAATFEEARRLLEGGAFALVLVNRITDSDGSEGLPFVRELAESGHNVMLVSNYADAQEQAVAHGALPGFGKNSLQDPQTEALIRSALQGRSR